MNRREFLKRSATTAAVAVAIPTMFTLTGCPVNQSQLDNLVVEIGNGVTAILPYIKSVSTDLAGKITQSFSALSTAIQAWTPGSVVTTIEEAVNDFVANMALIPPIADYQPLVALVVATAEGIINLLVPGTPTPVASVSLVEKSRHRWPHPPRSGKEFRTKWNREVNANPKLHGLAIS